MAKSTTSSAGTAPKRRSKIQPKAATLYGYINTYITANDIGEDQSIGVILQKLRDSIVTESQAA
jgi:hypothetical protein